MPTNDTPAPSRLRRLLTAPAHAVGLLLGGVALAGQLLGLFGSRGWALAALGYGIGFVIGGLWFGWPAWRAEAWPRLAFSDEGDARQAVERALQGVRQFTERNPQRRLTAPLQQRVLALCAALDELLQQWERSRGSLSLQDGFDARHIAISHLPEALNTYGSIPSAYAATRVLANGKTAQETFLATLDQLAAKVRELGDDLAAQDAEAFLRHSRFLNQKFNPAGLPDDAAAPPPA